MRDEYRQGAAGSTGGRVSIRRAGLAFAPAPLSDARMTLRAFAAEARAAQLLLIPHIPLDPAYPTRSRLSRLVPVNPT